ncbi:MAG TPA: peptidylprolyl isomerase [Candidatus Angelobacter sp.]|jgi:peptidyl-prolyl cis-trans isomerase A (cyclophilin A)|nr:peptidylprolyl isomerase [Candidatus Angelobacter sp.]
MLRHSAVLFLTLGLAVAASGQTASKATGTQKTAAGTKRPTAATASKNPVAVIHTTIGDLRCELFPDKTPQAVANFIGLAQGTKDWTNPTTQKVEHNKPLYDGTIFQRVIPDFMIQGGDPTGTGTGGSGGKLQDELFPDLLFDKPGRLAYANSGPNSSSSQFFITEKERYSLNPCFSDQPCPGLVAGPHAGYTIFGQCDAPTVTLVKKIARMSRDEHDRPYAPVKIKHIDILNLKGAGTKAPAGKTPGAKTTTGPGKTAPKQ